MTVMGTAGSPAGIVSVGAGMRGAPGWGWRRCITIDSFGVFEESIVGVDTEKTFVPTGTG